ncbi:hypothetical protein GX48_05140 [Paracoccidioides brasiliensis]|nr:hypothetical protein GX48_05140 [Paracoccidioides brasiliensis]
MKKQYQDIFNANEIEKQKRKRSRRQIQQEVGGLTSEEVQSLLASPAPPAEPAAPVEQLVIQSHESSLSAPAPRRRAPQRCSNSLVLKVERLKSDV